VGDESKGRRSFRKQLAEGARARAALVLQNDIANRSSPVTIVAAITSQIEAPLHPTEVLVRAPEGGLVDRAVRLSLGLMPSE
jgi:mRNA interferase MazF